jgi:hypothetical protein
MKRSSVISGFFVIAMAGLVAGCASKPPAAATALVIGGQTLDSLIPAAERTRIERTFPAAYRGNILIAEGMGKTIYRRQQLAVRAGNAYRAQPKTRHSKLAGWLVIRNNGALEVLFIAKRNKRPHLVATASGTAPEIETVDPPRRLTTQEAALWRARALAFTARIGRCSHSYLPVAFPVKAAGEKRIFVYLLPLAPANTMMLGGYYRIRISADGTRILDTHSYTRSCLKMKRNPKAMGIAVTENESPTPTAPQVYANLRYGLPVYVSTTQNHRQWKIEQGRISPLETPSRQ